MKDFRGMKRQRSRNRKPSGNSNNPNRAYESNGPEGTKVRGNAQTIYEKYQQMARDANSSGDRVLAENHLQHAEHYFRLIRQMQPTRPVSEFVQRDPFSNGLDFDEDDMDGDGIENDGNDTASDNVEQQPVMDEPRYDNRRDNRDSRPNGERVNGERVNGERFNGNGNRDRNNRDRDRNSNGNGNRVSGERNFEQRSFEPRANAERPVEPRSAAPAGREFEARDGDVDGLNGERRETRRERYERRRAQRLNEQEYNLNGGAVPGAINGGGEVTAPAFIASTEPLGAKPARAAAPEPAPVSADASHLPAFLRAPAPVVAAVAEVSTEDAPAKPKRGRPKRKAEEVSAEDA